MDNEKAKETQKDAHPFEFDPKESEALIQINRLLEQDSADLKKRNKRRLEMLRVLKAGSINSARTIKTSNANNEGKYR